MASTCNVSIPALLDMFNSPLSVTGPLIFCTAPSVEQDSSWPSGIRWISVRQSEAFPFHLFPTLNNRRGIMPTCINVRLYEPCWPYSCSDGIPLFFLEDIHERSSHWNHFGCLALRFFLSAIAPLSIPPNLYCFNAPICDSRLS